MIVNYQVQMNAHFFPHKTKEHKFAKMPLEKATLGD